MAAALASGLLLGLSCGLAPGVLLTLVIAQTLRHGAREGCKVALAPLVTDLPIILLALVFAARLAEFQTLLGIVSIAGGFYVLWLAVDSFRAGRADAAPPECEPQSLRKGIVANFLNPNPWLFWFTAGAATLSKALAVGWLAAAVFLAAFYALLCGGKMAVAWLTARSRGFLTGGAYHWIMRTLGVLLALFAVLLFRDGMRCLGSAIKNLVS
jgi:threonine/homoserine/homoserine lactone efflux protein